MAQPVAMDAELVKVAMEASGIESEKEKPQENPVGGGEDHVLMLISRIESNEYQGVDCTQDYINLWHFCLINLHEIATLLSVSSLRGPTETPMDGGIRKKLTTLGLFFHFFIEVCREHATTSAWMSQATPPAEIQRLLGCIGIDNLAYIRRSKNPVVLPFTIALPESEAVQKNVLRVLMPTYSNYLLNSFALYRVQVPDFHQFRQTASSILFCMRLNEFWPAPIPDFRPLSLDNTLRHFHSAVSNEKIKQDGKERLEKSSKAGDEVNGVARSEAEGEAEGKPKRDDYHKRRGDKSAPSYNKSNKMVQKRTQQPKAAKPYANQKKAKPENPSIKEILYRMYNF